MERVPGSPVQGSLANRDDVFLDALEASFEESKQKKRRYIAIFCFVCWLTFVVSASLYFGWQDMAPDIVFPILCSSAILGAISLILLCYR